MCFFTANGTPYWHRGGKAIFRQDSAQLSISPETFGPAEIAIVPRAYFPAASASEEFFQTSLKFAGYPQVFGVRILCEWVEHNPMAILTAAYV